MKHIKSIAPIAGTIGLLLILSSASFAQFKVPKYGSVSMKEINMSNYPADSSANAVILFDVGSAYLTYNKTNEAFELERKRHIRIKILNRDGLDWAEASIALYRNSSNREKLYSLKAHTYNLVGDKIEEIKLPKSAMFSDEVNENFTAQKFTFPQAKEGSVIEYSYTITSPFIYSLEPWSFQSSIPAIYSEYEVKIPEYFDYQFNISGYENVSTSKRAESESIVFSEFTRETSGHNTQSKHNSTTVSYVVNISKHIAQNIPALKNEPFLDNKENYQSKIEFELQTTKFPGSLLKYYSESWGTIVEKLLEHEKFGKQLDSRGFLKNEIKGLALESKTDKEKVVEVINFIKSKVKWNDYYSLYTKEGVKSAFKNGSGNSSDLNLLLIVALREAGIDAFPIALSTRSNGIIQSWQKTVARFNHVITGIELENGLNLYDATSNFKALNTLPLGCINGQGRIIDIDNNKWVDLNPNNLSKSAVYAQFKLTEEGKLIGKISSTQRDYFAQRFYNSTNSEKKLEDFKESLSSDFNNGQIDSLNIEYSSLNNADVKFNFNVESSDFNSSAGDFIYFTPGKGLLMMSTNLTSNERKLPLNFHFPKDETYIIKYKIPNGYAVDELPKNENYVSLEGNVQYMYSIVQVGDEVVLTCRNKVNKMLFLPTEYPDFKLFFDKIASKNSEKVVLKKI
jgi:hypothetical protein